MRRVIRENLGSMLPGQDLLVAGFIGWEGTRAIVKEKEAELTTWFSSWYLREIKQNNDVILNRNLEQWNKFGITECEPVEAGGIMNALWNLSGAYETGIEFELRQIPIKQETVEICEYFDLNPYRLLSSNCCILVADNGGNAARTLERNGISCTVIGKVNRGIKREIYNGGSVGFLERPRNDEIEKVLPGFIL